MQRLVPVAVLVTRTPFALLLLDCSCSEKGSSRGELLAVALLRLPNLIVHLVQEEEHLKPLHALALVLCFELELSLLVR